MSTREKRLLFLLVGALVVVVGLYGFNRFMTFREGIATEIETLRQEREMAELAQRSRQGVQEEEQWLAQNRPEPQEGDLMPSKLQGVTTQLANRAGLTVKQETIRDNRSDGQFYDRARFRISVTGNEASLYRWLVQLQSPQDFRAVTNLRLNPNRQDDTKIDAEVQVEQWFRPKVQGETSASPSGAES